MAADLPQMKLYCEIGRLASGRAIWLVEAGSDQENPWVQSTRPQPSTVRLIRVIIISNYLQEMNGGCTYGT